MGLIPERWIQPDLAGPSDDVFSRALLEAIHRAAIRREQQALYSSPLLSRDRRNFFEFAATSLLFLHVKTCVGKMNGHTP
jgi:hypothetical protein